MKNKLYTILALCLIATGWQNANAQFSCGTDLMMQKLFAENPGMQQDHEKLLAQSRQEASLLRLQNPNAQSAPIYVIPVVFHIIHQYGSEDISDAQVQDEMNILNKDYRDLNADANQVIDSFLPIVADCEIEFRLATKDPQGNCTNGIDRIYSHETNQADDEAKLNQWPRDKYLNVWVVKTIGSVGVAGYAFYPSAVTGIMYTHDGIIILHDYIGSIGTGTAFTSRALTHEIGHYLSLQHTWGSNNQPTVACGDDGIADTPVTKGWLTCPAPTPPYYLQWVICGFDQSGTDTIPENVQNYMEYSYCSKMFTLGQKAAMFATLQSAVSGRNNLSTYSNHVSTGTDTASLTANPYTFPAILASLPVCVPVADFSANKLMVCQGGTVTFTDRSWRSPVTSRSWTFSNGTPATSTATNPTVTFSTWGWQTITITATNSAGSDTKTKNAYIYVCPPWYDYFGVYSESFENNNFAQKWVKVNGITMGDEINSSVWQQTTAAAATGSNSIMINTFGSDNNVVDELITPSYNLTTTTGMTLTFKYSAASVSIVPIDVNETLKIYTSTDCGSTWTLRSSITGNTLCNAGYSSGYFVPNSNQWASYSLNLNTNQANVHIKFQLTTGAGPNNLYLDDININGTTGDNEMQNYNFGLSVYPNPSKGDDFINVAYALTSTENINIALYDLTGREVGILVNEKQTAGEKTVTIDKNALGLTAGVYMVKITNGLSYTTQKIVITN